MLFEWFSKATLDFNELVVFITGVKGINFHGSTKYVDPVLIE